MEDKNTSAEELPSSSSPNTSKPKAESDPRPPEAQASTSSSEGNPSDTFKLIYCVHPAVEDGAEGAPEWVGQIDGMFDPTRVDAIPVCTYSPASPYRTRVTSPVLKQILDERDVLARPGAESYVKESPWLRSPPSQRMMHAVAASYTGNTKQKVDLDLYFLLRADYVFIDIDRVSSIGAGLVIPHARALGIPCVGVGQKFMVHPWLDRFLDLRVAPDLRWMRAIIWET